MVTIPSVGQARIMRRNVKMLKADIALLLASPLRVLIAQIRGRVQARSSSRHAIMDLSLSLHTKGLCWSSESSWPLFTEQMFDMLFWLNRMGMAWEWHGKIFGVESWIVKFMEFGWRLMYWYLYLGKWFRFTEKPSRLWAVVHWPSLVWGSFERVRYYQRTHLINSCPPHLFFTIQSPKSPKNAMKRTSISRISWSSGNQGHHEDHQPKASSGGTVFSIQKYNPRVWAHMEPI